ncbi:hypothetical protein I3271_13545 [Photobacterium leiognathi]|uniref:hypothetical protein n=1 Tax=Photobacterium leiognathi TaxID=553611 RepID=UPI001EDDFDB6|nr:hypothetical protein [Photobacterium leiognathi]MCG3885694.1 hypothetical protein [Photobacterium leiognathi]
MKLFISLIAGFIFILPLTLHAKDCANSSTNMNNNNSAQSSTSGPRVECLLPNGDVDYIPAMFCKIKYGKYHF